MAVSLSRAASLRPLLRQTSFTHLHPPNHRPPHIGGTTIRHLQQSTVINPTPSTAIHTFRSFINDIAKLSKHRLSALVAITASAGFICRYDPLPTTSENNNNSNNNPSFYRTLSSTTIGTFLTAASANTLNQIYERRSDYLMTRTRNRPLPSGRIPPRLALLYAALTATTGLTLLQVETNSTATALAAANLTLYSAVYTPLKAISTLNTPIGAIVGALPPLIGWSAASGGSLVGGREGRREDGVWPLAALLFLWQIPHFHALAVALRKDYASAGLRMLAVSNPVANARWARVAALALVPLGAAFYWAGVTSEAFVWQSALLSMWMARAAGPLMRDVTSVQAARGLFRASIVHLPACLALLMLHRTTPEMAMRQRERDVIAGSVGGASAASVGREEEDGGHMEERRRRREIRIHQPWEVIAPFPFLPVPRGAPAVVIDANE